MSKLRPHQAPRCVTGSLNRWVGIIVCLFLAGLCGYLFQQNQAYSRTLETNGVTVVGTIVGQTLRPCELGDICYRRRGRSLTHVGHATISYRDDTGMSLQGKYAINNRNAEKYRRGQRISVRFPRGDANNPSFGDQGFNERARQLTKLLYGLGLLALIGGAFWLWIMPNHELADT